MQLIERENDLLTLASGIKKIPSEGGHNYIITGEAGIGKTMLLNHFLNNLPTGVKFYIGNCDSLSTPRPLSPIIDLAMQLKTDWSEPFVNSLSRGDLFNHFAQDLINKRETIVIVFEDIHWADEATIDYIKFLARRISKTRCMFIITCRDTDFEGDRILSSTLSGLPSDTYTRVPLKPLSQTAVSRLAEQKGYDGENLYLLTNGNPFFVHEIIANYSPGVPANVKDAVLTVFRHQNDATKNLWEILSVIPDGLKTKLLSKIDPKWHEAIETCLNAKILIANNDKIQFKHELYRRTIEESFSPIKKINLHKYILESFFELFKDTGEIEKIIHHAKNANLDSIVYEFAPIAAQQASIAGAHLEASKLYLTAIKYAGKRGETELVELYKSYAYECYLTNQITEAILYQTNVFELERLQNNMEETASNLLFLSRLWRLEGNNVKTEKCAVQAIEMLKDLPASKVKGMAFSNFSEVKMYSANTLECIEWGEKALAIGREINDNVIISHALNNIGSALWRQTKDTAKGEQFLYKSLTIAFEHNLEVDVDRAQTNIIFSLIIVKEYNKARSLLTENNLYCEQRNLNTSKPFTLYLEARILLETGNWNEADSIADNLIKYQVHPEAVRIGALTIAAVLKLRKGDPEAEICLVTVKEMAFKTKEYQIIMPVVTAILEYEWLSGKTLLSAKELETCFNLIARVDCGTANSEFAFWLYKSRKTKLAIKEPYTPYKYILENKITNAVIFWDELGCPYEKAITLLDGDEENKKKGLMELQEMGATAIFEKAKKIVRAAGIRRIPRGKRASTISNPAHLTNREIEVLQLLQTGRQNKEIASSLFISAKTVDHHISSILFKLDVNSRNKAVAEAVKLGILQQIN